MSSPYHRGGDTGSPTFGHALLSSGDELQKMAVSQKRRVSGRRKALRMKKAKARNAARISAVNDSDASVEDVENNGDNDDAALNSSASDDEEPRVFAPSGALKKSALSSQKLKRRAPNTPVRQAGRNKSSPLSPTTLKLQALASPYRTRNSEKVRFDLENVAKRSPTPNEEEVDGLTDNLGSGSEDDDVAYAQLNLIPDSDSAEEDDDAIEDLETQYLIEHLEANGELPQQEESVFASVYDDLEHSAQFDNTESELDSYFVVPTTELDHTNNAAASTAETSPILGGAFDAQPPELEAVELLPMPEMSRPKPETAETGLQTPSSLPQSIIMRDYDDDEETEAEEPRVRSVSGARLKRLSGLSAPASTPKGVRKNSKPKTPKLGSFKIARKDTILQHKNGELVFTRKGKVAANGTITPKGVLTSDFKHKKPIKAIPLADPFIQAITAPSSTIPSPTALAGPFLGDVILQEAPILTTDVIGFGPSVEQQAEELFKDFIVSKN